MKAVGQHIRVEHDGAFNTRILVDGEDLTAQGGVESATLEFTADSFPKLILRYACFYDLIEYDGPADVVHLCPQQEEE